MLPRQLVSTMQRGDTTRKSTTSLVSNTSGSIKKLTSSYQKIYTLETINTDKPLPSILKPILKRARQMLLQKNIITDSLADKDKFPTYDLSEPLKCTARELTLKLIRQHDYLLHRVVAMTETIIKKN